MKPFAARRAALLLLPALLLVGCAGESTGNGSDPSPSASSSGVTATGSFGEKPTLTIPKGEPPTTLVVEVLQPGDGAEVQKGETLVANYLGQTWDPNEDGSPNVFDNSYDKKQPVGFPIGVGKVIKGWDQGLVGQKVGSRVLLTIPPALAYGETPSDSDKLAGKTLVFVVDIVDSLAKDRSAEGTEVTPTTPGLPKVDSQSGKKPTITSTAGVKPGKTPISGLLIEGKGDPIDESKSLALQIIQADATGKVGQDSWTQDGPQLVPAKSVLGVAAALKGKPVGSRVSVVTAAQNGQPGVILVLDVVGQY